MDGCRNDRKNGKTADLSQQANSHCKVITGEDRAGYSNVLQLPVIALPAGAVIAWAIIARAIVTTIVVRSAIIVRPRIVGAVIVPAVIGLSVVARAEVIKQKRERERDTPTHTLGSGRELGESQGADSEQKNQQLIHTV